MAHLRRFASRWISRFSASDRRTRSTWDFRSRGFGIDMPERLCSNCIVTMLVGMLVARGRPLIEPLKGAAARWGLFGLLRSSSAGADKVARSAQLSASRQPGKKPRNPPLLAPGACARAASMGGTSRAC